MYIEPIWPIPTERMVSINVASIFLHDLIILYGIPTYISTAYGKQLQTRFLSYCAHSSAKANKLQPIITHELIGT